MTDEEFDALTAPQHFAHIAPYQPRGSGLSVSAASQRPARSSCPQRNNPHGHNPECLCGWAVSDV